MLNFHETLIYLYNNQQILSKEQILQGGRNLVFMFNDSGKEKVVVKFFKTPNIFKALIYGSFRKSKAYRSYHYACKLIELGIGTPKPVSFFEEKQFGMLKKSYYCSEFIDPDYTFRDLTLGLSIPDFERVIRQFTQFTFKLHESGVEFNDHSPGNTLIRKKVDGNYEFFLVDLNRMNFGEMNFEKRMKNFSRLTKDTNVIKIISEEYSNLYNCSYDKVFLSISENVKIFQRNFLRKKKFKKIILSRK